METAPFSLIEKTQIKLIKWKEIDNNNLIYLKLAVGNYLEFSYL